MKAFLFSISLSLFLIIFTGTHTRLDDAYISLRGIYPEMTGDLVLLSGAAIVVGVVASVVKAFKK